MYYCEYSICIHVVTTGYIPNMDARMIYIYLAIVNRFADSHLAPDITTVTVIFVRFEEGFK